MNERGFNTVGPESGATDLPLPEAAEDPWARFEHLRLAAFARHGATGHSRRIVDAEGRQTYAVVTDTGEHRGVEACPTVLVHGGVGNGIEWSQIAGRLDGPMVMPDRPGLGLTSPHDYRDVDFRADAARWLRDLADGLAADQVNLVAGSMGGYFAIAFAAAYPERVRRLILSGAAGGLFPRPGLFLQLWATPGIGALISRLKLRDIETLRKRAFGGYVVHPERLPNDLLEVALAGVNLPGTADTNRAILQAVTTFRGWRPDMRLNDTLAALDVPTLFIWGTKDSLAPATTAQGLVSQMKNATLVTLEDAGHIPHLDQPESVAEAIVQFIADPEL